LKQKRRNKKLTVKERFVALTIGALAVLLFIAAFFMYQKVAGGGMGQEEAGTPAEKPSVVEDSVNAIPLKAPPAASGAREAAETAAATSAPKTAIPPPSGMPPVRPQPAKPPAKQAAELVAQAPPERPRPPRPERKISVVYVIDDAGNNLRELEPFLRFPGALTIAVLPGLPHSAKAAQMVREAGKEVFLHQPMEAVGGANPGPGAIYIGMSREEVIAILEKNVREIGPISGMNNHQGSLVTQDEGTMKVVLEFCCENGLYFLDSRTIAGTVVPKVAREAGVSIAERNIFLDNEQDMSAIEMYLEQGLDIARKKSIAVMIGHTWSPELAGILADSYTALSAEGYVFLTVSKMMEGINTR
jgi:polysaccharide deacetylase 2 family uncharacterized protein YibQ